MAQGLLSKLLGSNKQRKYPLSEKDAEQWPELEMALASLATTEIPEDIKTASKIKPMNFIERMLMPNRMGNYNPITNTVSLNKNKLSNDMELKDTLVHELTHSRQRNQHGSGILQTMFGNRDAQESQAEGQVYKRNPRLSLPKTDINLPLLPNQIKDTRLIDYNKELVNNILATPISKRDLSLYAETHRMSESPSYSQRRLNDLRGKGNPEWNKDINLPLLPGQKKDPRLLRKVYNGK